MRSMRVSLFFLILGISIAAYATISGAAGGGGLPPEGDECQQITEAIVVKIAQLNNCNPIPMWPGGFSECAIIQVELDQLRAEARVVCWFTRP